MGIRRKRLVPGKIETQVARPVERTSLGGVGAQSVPQRSVNEMGRGVGPGTFVARAGIHPSVDDISQAQLALGDLHRVADQPRDRLLHIDNRGLEITPLQNTLIGDLATRFCIERGFRQDNFRQRACCDGSG